MVVHSSRELDVWIIVACVVAWSHNTSNANVERVAILENGQGRQGYPRLYPDYRNISSKGGRRGSRAAAVVLRYGKNETAEECCAHCKPKCCHRALMPGLGQPCPMPAGRSLILAGAESTESARSQIRRYRLSKLPGTSLTPRRHALPHSRVSRVLQISS